MMNPAVCLSPEKDSSVDCCNQYPEVHEKAKEKVRILGLDGPCEQTRFNIKLLSIAKE